MGSDKSAVKHNTTTRRSGDTQDISRRQSGDRRQEKEIRVRAGR